MSDTHQVDEQAIISKIEALLRKANHPNTGPAEREAFQAKALALMTKHRIASVSWEQDDPEPLPRMFETIRGTYARYLHQIVMAICRCYGCYTFFEGSGRAGDPARTIYIFGFKRDNDRVANLSRLFMEDARQQSIKMSPPSSKPDDTIRWRANFIAGYAAEIQRRYQEAKQQLDQEQAGWATTGNALVLVDRDKQVTENYDRFRKSNGLRKAGGSRMRGDLGAHMAGQEAARNSNIGRERIGGTGRALPR